jgi:hypothetical protein
MKAVCESGTLCATLALAAAAVAFSASAFAQGRAADYSE